MKLVNLIVVAALAASCGQVFAQNPDPARPEPAKVTAPANGMRITKVTGTVNILKNGVIIQTLKPGDVVPAITGDKITFSIVYGTLEMVAGGKSVTAPTGAEFTVTTRKREVEVSLGAGSPVSVRTESGHTVVLEPGSRVRMISSAGKVDIRVEKGNAVYSDASGGGTRTMKAGGKVSVPMGNLPGRATASGGSERYSVRSEAGETPAGPAAEVPAEPLIVLPVVEPPPSGVIPTQTVEEGKEVSASNP